MDLQDASEQASVNQFIRSLEFPFNRETIAGIPGAFFGPSAKTGDERCALLMHELEHVLTLTSPLGMFYTALALRLKDLHDNAAVRSNAWHAKIQEKIEPGTHIEALGVVEDMARAAQLTRFVLCACDYILPLLEGLATIAELELTMEEDAHGASLMLAFEFWRRYYLSLLGEPKKIIDFEDDSKRESILLSLVEELDSQLKLSRARRLILLGERVLFGTGSSAERLRASPYFLGYLIVRRMMQQWKQISPRLPDADLFRLARIAISRLLPLTLLMARIKRDEVAGNGIWLDESVVAQAIRSLLTLNAGQLDHVLSGKLVALDLDSYDLTLASNSEDFDDDVTRWVMAGLFSGLSSDERKQTEKVLWLAERSKFVKKLDTIPVLLTGVNEKHRLALLKGKPQSASTGPAGISSTVWFLFKDEDFAEFLRIYDSLEPKLSKVDLREALNKTPGPLKVIAGMLSTYCVFHPFGVRSSEDNSLPTPIAVIHRLTLGSGQNARMFESGMVSLQDISATLDWQEHNSRFAEAVRKALNPSLKQYCDIFSGIDDLYKRLYAQKVIEDSFAEAMRQTTGGEEDEVTSLEQEFYDHVPNMIKASRAAILESDPEWHRRMQSGTRLFYAGLLFPRCQNGEAAALLKLDYLRGYLTIDSHDQLRKWVLYGAALSKEGCYPVPVGESKQIEEEVEHVREVCLRELGIPLVGFDRRRGVVVLELVPRSIELG